MHIMGDLLAHHIKPVDIRIAFDRKQMLLAICDSIKHAIERSPFRIVTMATHDLGEFKECFRYGNLRPEFVGNFRAKQGWLFRP